MEGCATVGRHTETRTHLKSTSHNAMHVMLRAIWAALLLLCGAHKCSVCVKPRSLLWLWYSPSEGPLLTPNGYLAGRLGRAYLGGYSFCKVLARLGG